MGVSSELSWLLFRTTLTLAGAIVFLLGTPLVGLLIWVFTQLKKQVESISTHQAKSEAKRLEWHTDHLTRMVRLEENQEVLDKRLDRIDDKLDHLLTKGHSWPNPQ